MESTLGVQPLSAAESATDYIQYLQSAHAENLSEMGAGHSVLENQVRELLGSTDIKQLFDHEQTPWERYHEIMQDLFDFMVENAFRLADNNGDGWLNGDEIIQFLLLAGTGMGGLGAGTSQLRALILLLQLLAALKGDDKVSLEDLMKILLAASSGDSQSLEALLLFLQLLLEESKKEGGVGTNATLLAFIADQLANPDGMQGKAMVALLALLSILYDRHGGIGQGIEGVLRFLQQLLEDKVSAGNVSLDSLLSSNLLQDLLSFFAKNDALAGWLITDKAPRASLNPFLLTGSAI